MTVPRDMPDFSRVSATGGSYGLRGLHDPAMPRDIAYAPPDVPDVPDIYPQSQSQSQPQSFETFDIPDGPMPTPGLNTARIAGGMPVRRVPTPPTWLGSLHPAIIEGERAKYYGPIARSNYQDSQVWMALDPELGVDYEIAAKMATPAYGVAFDFQTLEPSDEIVIRVEIEVRGPRPDQFTWRIQELYTIGVLYQGRPIGESPSRTQQMRTVNGQSARTHLTVNGDPISRGRFLTIEPLTGPWPARIIYRQTRGMNKYVRFLLV